MTIVRMQQRRGTAAQWISANPILAAGEIGVETDTLLTKIGNGANSWTALPYVVSSGLASLSELTPTDGQTVEWDTTLGEWLAINPVGNSLNAQANNTTSTPTGISSASGLGTIVAIAGTAISVTNSNGRSVELQFEGTFFQSVVGTGSVYLSLYETTGAATHRKSNVKPLPNSVAAAQSTLSMGMSAVNIGVVTTTRTFELRAAVYQASGSPAGSMLNQPTAQTTLKAINL